MLASRSEPIADDDPVEVRDRQLAQGLLLRAVGPDDVGEPPVHLLHELLARVDAEHVGARRHQLEGEGGAEPAQPDDGDRVRLRREVLARAETAQPVTNDRPLLRELVRQGPRPHREGGREQDRPEPAREHQRAAAAPARPGGRSLRDPGRQPRGRERRHRLEREPVDGLVGQQRQHDGRADDHADGDQGHRDRLAVHGAGQPLAEHVHGGPAAHLGDEDEEQHAEGGDLDAARGAGGTAADEHQHVHHDERRAVELPDVDGREAAAAGLRRLEEARQQLRGPVERAEGAASSPTRPR